MNEYSLAKVQEYHLYSQYCDPLKVNALSTKYQTNHSHIIPKLIKEAYSNFEFDDIYKDKSVIIEEILINLDKYATSKDRIRYIITILSAFKDFSDPFYPMRFIAGKEREIRWDRELMKEIENEVNGNDDSRKDTGFDFISSKEKEIAFHQDRSHKLIRLCNANSDPRQQSELTIEYILFAFWHIMIEFSTKLKALLLTTYKIDLMDVQRECGVYISNSDAPISYVDGYYVPNWEYAQKQLELIGDRNASILTDAREIAKKGRPSAKPFEDYIKSDAPKNLLPVLEDVLNEKKGKDAARIIIAITGIWINEPPTESVCEKFPSVKHSAFNRAKNQHFGLNGFVGKAKPFSKEELEDTQTQIRKKLGLN